MPLLQAAQAFVARRLARAVAPIHQRIHHRLYKPPSGLREARARAAGAWWSAEPRWYPLDTPPRRHNRVTPLVDGSSFFEALAGAIAGAHSYIYIAGWCLTPYIPLRRADEQALIETRLLTLLDQRSQEIPVRILLWSGALALLQPTRRTARELQRVLERQASGDLQCRLDMSAHFSHCHHQKAVVVDGRVAFVGGMDLTSFQGDRWDLHRHPLRSGPNWHDVQLQIAGEAVADVERNFRQRWAAVGGGGDLPHCEPVVEPAWQTPVQIVRTIPRRTYDFAAGGVFGIRYSSLELLRRAQRLVYIENQYLWAPEICEALIEAMDRRRSEPFRIVIVLPARAYSGKWDNDRHIARLRRADRGRGIVSAYCLYASGPSAGRRPFRYRPVYVHAKAMIVDDEWLSVGSANLNDRGLVTDSELNAVVHDPGLAHGLRAQLWAEHLALPVEQVATADPIELVDGAWKERARRNALIVQQGREPLTGSVHRYELGRMPGSWLLEEAEALTFEH